MKTISKILVPTDLTENSLLALGYAMMISKMSDAKIYVVHVLDRESIISLNTSFYTPGDFLSEIEKQARIKMDELEKKYLTNYTRIYHEIIYGIPYKEISDYAVKNQIDMIVMTSHNKSRISRFFLGSVAEKVIRYSTVPVLVVKAEEEDNALVKESEVENQLNL